MGASRDATFAVSSMLEFEVPKIFRKSKHQKNKGLQAEVMDSSTKKNTKHRCVRFLLPLHKQCNDIMKINPDSFTFRCRQKRLPRWRHNLQPFIGHNHTDVIGTVSRTKDNLSFYGYVPGEYSGISPTMLCDPHLRPALGNVVGRWCSCDVRDEETPQAEGVGCCRFQKPSLASMSADELAG